MQDVKPIAPAMALAMAITIFNTILKVDWDLPSLVFPAFFVIISLVFSNNNFPHLQVALIYPALITKR